MPALAVRAVRAAAPVVALLASALPLAGQQLPAPARPKPFRITVVDAATGRGVPLVELTTVHGVVHVTDSAGVVAYDEPGLMDAEVFFHVKSHGYRYPKDGFGYAGLRLRTVPGGSATVQLERVNVAQRLYRITGQGIYRDSVMLGDTVPVAAPLLNGKVVGQDSVQTALYRGRVHWFWGDTSRAAYPLGNFAMAGATSELPPPRGTGLDPGRGIDLRYFTDADGFARPMCPIPGEPGPVWCDGFVTAADAGGRERLLCHFARMKSLGERHEHGFAVFDDERQVFVPTVRIPLDAPLHARGGGSPVRWAGPDGEHWYFATPFPLVRCRASYEALQDPAQYEAYTCLQPGARWDAAAPRLEIEDGRPVYGWKRDTGLVLQQEQDVLIEKGLLRPEHALLQLRCAATGERVRGHAGTVAWNDYRGRWIMIVQEGWGTSLCGEVWFAEAPELTGPWALAHKIVTHDDYSFYNVAHHPFFDQQGGRIVYFEGTYTAMFSGTKVPTPRYDYNQILYALDLADPRLGPR
ncbi:MAG: hypothetical protein FJ265_01975 [Planctomycetes bacterium]|nr:hypothetical protein [Planctomycetota bacterium]